MPLFVDEEGRTYYSVNSLNPVTGRYSFPMHFNGAPGEPPVQRGPLLRLPEAAFGRALLWGTLLACLNVILLSASVIGWWSGVPDSNLGGVAAMIVTGLFQFLVMPHMGQRVPFDRPVRYWGMQPFELLLLELTGRAGFVFTFLTLVFDRGQQMALIPALIIGSLLVLPVWQLARRLFAAHRNGSVMIP